jgi:putative oxidoreductase
VEPFRDKELAMTFTTSRGWSVGVWVVSGLLALLVLFAGTTKLAAWQMHVEQFAHWGYPQWFMFVVGAWEVVGAILLVIPATSFYAAAFLAIDMIGAVYTTAIRVSEPRTAIVPCVLLVVLALVAHDRRPAAAGRLQAA